MGRLSLRASSALVALTACESSHTVRTKTGAGNAMQFEMMHLSMLPRPQKDLFERIAVTREAWLRDIFSEKITFMHFREQFFYVPEPDKTIDAAPLIAGRIGRRVSITENEPPESGLHETQRPSWAAASIFIDPRHHDEGQKVAFQYRDDIGQPLSIFLDLAKHINTNSEPLQPYAIEVAPISDADSFWDFAAKNKGNVTCVAFDLVTPNMFDGPENMDKEMKEMRDQERARKIKFELENPDSLDLDTQRVKTIVAYAAKGGGNIKARAKGRKSYNSKKKIKTVTIDDPEQADAKSALMDVIKAVKVLIFGE
jgi:hypothetical protein